MVMKMRNIDWEDLEDKFLSVFVVVAEVLGILAIIVLFSVLIIQVIYMFMMMF